MSDYEMIRVVVADDERVVRDGLLLMLQTQPDVAVVGQSASGAETLDVCARVRPDVLLLDVRMPAGDGLSVLDGLARRGQLGPDQIRVVMLTTFDLQEYVDEALESGARGFLLKSGSYEEIVGGVRAAANDEAALNPRVARRLVDSYVTTRRSASPDGDDVERLRDLTPREREVLHLIGQGLNNAEISGRLVVSEHTVKTHVSRLLTKTGCRDRGQAAALARRAPAG